MYDIVIYGVNLDNYLRDIFILAKNEKNKIDNLKLPKKSLSLNLLKI